MHKICNCPDNMTQLGAVNKKKPKRHRGCNTESHPLIKTYQRCLGAVLRGVRGWSKKPENQGRLLKDLAIQGVEEMVNHLANKHDHPLHRTCWYLVKTLACHLKGQYQDTVGGVGGGPGGRRGDVNIPVQLHPGGVYEDAKFKKRRTFRTLSWRLLKNAIQKRCFSTLGVRATNSFLTDESEGLCLPQTLRKIESFGSPKSESAWPCPPDHSQPCRSRHPLLMR